MPIRLERITTAIPWPRGIVFHDGLLVVLARGRGRGAGGPDPSVTDLAGSLFEVDPTVSEWVDLSPNQAGGAVTSNGTLLTGPSAPPFNLWNPISNPASSDIETDRPYATLKWDPISTNYFICGFSGIDAAANPARFRKNTTDAVHRYDRVTNRWYPVDAHDSSVVPLSIRQSMTSSIPNQYYPHTSNPNVDPPPHGLLNGPDGLCVFDEYLLAVAKDNHRLAMYPLVDIQADTSAGPPTGRTLLEGTSVPRRGGGSPITIDGYSAVAVSGSFLYLGCRTNNVVVRFLMDGSGGLASPIEGDLVATFAAGTNLIDLEFSGQGDLFVTTASDGNVWNVGIPSPASPFNGTVSTPFLSLRSATAHANSKAINITFDADDFLIVATNNNDDPAGAPNLPGTIYRAVET